MKPSLPQTITIDGPVSAGKTTIGKIIAHKLGFLMVDTGLFYRVVTYLALKSKINVKDNQKTAIIARNTKIEFLSQNNKTIILANGHDITNFLCTPQIDKNVSYPSRNPKVRACLTRQMRKIAKGNSVVMVGRDIGTVVLPNADLKIWLDANPQERAKRRIKELKERGINIPFQEVLKDMKLRDKIDSLRKAAPMKIPKDAFIIDTTNLTIEEVVSKIMSKISSSCCKGP